MGFDVVMLSSAHSATDDRIFYRESKTLVEAGQSVCVVACHPQSEVLEGVHIRALPVSPTRRKRLLLGTTILRIALELRARLYIIHDPDLLAIGLLLRLLGKKVVYDAHENVPLQLLQKEWIPRPVRRALKPLIAVVEWVAAELLSGVIAAVPAIQARFSLSRTVLVRNFPTASALALFAQGSPLPSRANVVIYTGGLSRIRGIRELVEAFRELPEAELWLVGQFDDPMFQEELVSSLPLNVVWLGWRPHPEVLKLYRFAKLGALLLYPTPNHRCALPVKLFEYFGAGLPVVASDIPEYEELIEGCGLQVESTSVDQIRVAVRNLLAVNPTLTEMSERARHRALTSFNWQQEGIQLVKFCDRIVNKPVCVKPRKQGDTAPEALARHTAGS